MNDPYTVIQTILVTERSMDLKEQNKYIFKVHSRANKIDIKRAIEALYDVTVGAVNIMNRLGKMKRAGRLMKKGRRSNWKKAIVTLSGGSIDVI